MGNKITKGLLGLAVTAVLVIAALASLPIALAEDVVCTSDSLAGIFHNVQVPKGATCVLNPGVWVTGNVEVKAGGSFSASWIPIGKNLNSHEAATIVLLGVNIGGHAHIKKTTLGTSIISSEIAGNLEIENQIGGIIKVSENQIISDLKLKNNTTPLPASIGGNLIDGNLECEKNNPNPVASADNEVLGKKEGQCSVAAGF
ncbi:MAG: hypothetical protein ACRD3Z_04750 [Nitrososphaerales archaeon]